MWWQVHQRQHVACNRKHIGDQRAALRPWSCDRITFSIKSSHRHHPHIPTSTRATSTKENNVSKNTFVLRPCTARPHCQIVRSGSTSNNIVTELHLEKTLKKERDPSDFTTSYSNTLISNTLIELFYVCLVWCFAGYHPQFILYSLTVCLHALWVNIYKQTNEYVFFIVLF